MVKKIKSSLNYLNEEEGGFILQNNEELELIKVKNKHTGTSIAAVLYEPDPAEFGELILSKLIDGWSVFASVHTHPNKLCTPSSVDLKNLFTNFQKNIIYTPGANEVNLYYPVAIDSEEVNNTSLNDLFPLVLQGINKQFSKTHHWKKLIIS